MLDAVAVENTPGMETWGLRCQGAGCPIYQSMWLLALSFGYYESLLSLNGSNAKVPSAKC